ncbi:MAG: alpha/beta hydrolase [Candidatus Scalindua sp.]|nr:alpha/beta hydrolase [Candidatus Scalindua sp.]MCR4345354.1 alpha/beta hydrolase [Candidatus Scalindua sp.]
MILELEGVRAFYHCVGEGDNVILMHGWGGSTESFKPVFDYLSKNYKVYAFDFPGFGKSDLPPAVWGKEEYGKFFMNFLKSTGIERTNIIAHSFGGRIAIWLAANYPEKVNKLILINSAGIKPRRTVKYHIKVAIAKTGKKLFALSIFGKYREHLLNNLYNLIGSKDYQQQTGIMRSILVKVVNEDLRGLLPKIIAPTLLIWGENDKDVPLSSAKIMESEIKDAGLIVFKDAGHFSYLDKFSDFCVIVTRFFG